MRAGEFITEGQLRVDVPNEDWLNSKIAYARKKGRDRFGAPYFGATTAYIPNSENVVVPVDLLKQLPGMRNEQQNVRQDDLAAIMRIMKDTGRLPLNNRGEEYVPFVVVAYNGEAWINEGNHRIMAAARLGWDSLPIELKYYDGGERIKNGPLYPGKLGLL
jgi:hypothetical protein